MSLTDLGEEEQSFRKVSGDFLLQVKDQFLLQLCGRNVHDDKLDHKKRLFSPVHFAYRLR